MRFGVEAMLKSGPISCGCKTGTIQNDWDEFNERQSRRFQDVKAQAIGEGTAAKAEEVVAESNEAHNARI